MFRVVLEILLPVFAILLARWLLTNIGKVASSAARNVSSGTGQQQNPSGTSSTGGTLHKDPICGTYVAESTAFKSQAGAQSFFYCSEACRTKHIAHR